MGYFFMKSFPKPLDAKEEKEYLEKCRKGETEARNILIERNLRLVAHIAKKYGTADREMEDLISIGTIGLIKAVDTFDIEKEIRLATYASRCIDNELLMFMRSSKKQSREVYLYEPIGKDKEGNLLNLLDILEAEDEDIIESMDMEEKVKQLYRYVNKALNQREKQIIRYRYGLEGSREVTQREIAKEMGISRSYVSRIEKKALGKLRECFDKEALRSPAK